MMYNKTAEHLQHKTQKLVEIAEVVLIICWMLNNNVKASEVTRQKNLKCNSHTT